MEKLICGGNFFEDFFDVNFEKLSCLSSTVKQKLEEIADELKVECMRNKALQNEIHFVGTMRNKVRDLKKTLKLNEDDAEVMKAVDTLVDELLVRPLRVLKEEVDFRSVILRFFLPQFEF